MNLVDITQPRFGVIASIAYATRDNFTGNTIYQRPACYLNEEAAARLLRATELAGELGLRLKVFDAYRPPEAQWMMWRFRPDPDFLADPRRGSPHSRGAAIDLTLVNGDGRELDMGTAFDAFTPLSHHGASAVRPAAQRNRLLLLGLMTASGWDFYAREWWHYQLHDARRFPLIADGALAPPMM